MWLSKEPTRTKVREGSGEEKTRMAEWCDVLQSCRKLQDPMPEFAGLQRRHLEGVPSHGETRLGDWS